MIGETIGHYRITAKLGEGGMGAVYRARDTRLDRDVALKVLPAALESNPDSLARFSREAKVLASLNHPGIAAIYGVEDRALVMELVPGPILADRIANGPIPVEEILDIAHQITAALEYAHERGVVHRDLKPANIKIDPEGKVKILDFGIAKALGNPALASDDSDAATAATAATAVGTILGTAAYMAPEQARGRNVDKRADIWSFGVVLWEMLTGRRLFEGESPVDVLSKVLNHPVDLTAAPVRFRGLLARCLEHNPRDRLHDIGDVWFLLKDDEEKASTRAPLKTARSKPLVLGLAIVAAVLALALAVLSFIHFRETTKARVVRSSLLPPEKAAFAFTSNLGFPALSPDGRRLVFGVTGEDGKSQLWIQALDTGTEQPLPGTEGGIYPFWSPDSRSLAFFSEGMLKKIDAEGGAPIALAEAPSARGGSWGSKDVIVFAPSGDRGTVLEKVPAAGGKPIPATTLNPALETTHRFPWFLPDGDHFLFTGTRGGGSEKMNVQVGSLASNTSRMVGEADSNAEYAEGRLLYLRGSNLMVQPFDLKTLNTAGEAVPIAERVEHYVGQGSMAAFSAASGLLAYETGASGGPLRLTWFDRAGNVVGALGERKQFYHLEFSPDRKSLVASAIDAGGNADLWTYDVVRAVPSRLTFDPAAELFAVWSPDGQTVAFNSSRKGHLDLYRKAGNGSGEDEPLYADDLEKYPTSWSHDGKFLLYFAASGAQGTDLMLLPLTPERPPKPVPFLQTKFNEQYGQFSPDDRWVAYMSDESQRWEIYVAPLSQPRDRRQISPSGGMKPRWSPGAKEIIYEALDGRLMAADVRVGLSTVEVGAVHALFSGSRFSNGYLWDLSSDGKRILAAVPPDTQKGPERITLVENWATGLKK